MELLQPQDSEDIGVPRRLLREILADGCCPLHLRLRLGRLLSSHSAPAHELRESGALARQIDGLGSECLAVLASYLPLSEVLSVRACSQESLQWAMDDGARAAAPSQATGARLHDCIRARLWLQRVEDITAGTKDASIFMTRMRSLADDALRSRMEAEMQDSLRTMEEQIRTFQSEVDRRLEDQERHVRQMVEERVQQELDKVLASEMVRIQALVEERLRDRVSKTFKQELMNTVREYNGRLDSLKNENVVLSNAFAESNFRAKCLFWAARPTLAGFSLLGGRYSLDVALWPLQRRLKVAAMWHPLLKGRPLREMD